MTRFLFGFSFLAILLLVPQKAKADVLRKLTLSSSSFDSGFVNIVIDSNQHAAVDWSADPFRRPQPNKKPWKKEFKVKQELSSKIFSTLDEIRFTKIESGRTQAPDEPSATYKEFRDGKELHAVTYPNAEIPKSIQKLDAVLLAIYHEAEGK